jgi:hypothetical protein
VAEVFGTARQVPRAPAQAKTLQQNGGVLRALPSAARSHVSGVSPARYGSEQRQRGAPRQ